MHDKQDNEQNWGYKNNTKPCSDTKMVEAKSEDWLTRRKMQKQQK